MVSKHALVAWHTSRWRQHVGKSAHEVTACLCFSNPSRLQRAKVAWAHASSALLTHWNGHCIAGTTAACGVDQHQHQRLPCSRVSTRCRCAGAAVLRCPSSCQRCGASARARRRFRCQRHKSTVASASRVSLMRSYCTRQPYVRSAMPRKKEEASGVKAMPATSPNRSICWLWAKPCAQSARSEGQDMLGWAVQNGARLVRRIPKPCGNIRQIETPISCISVGAQGGRWQVLGLGRAMQAGPPTHDAAQVGSTRSPRPTWHAS